MNGMQPEGILDCLESGAHPHAVARRDNELAGMSTRGHTTASSTNALNLDDAQLPLTSSGREQQPWAKKVHSPWDLTTAMPPSWSQNTPQVPAERHEAESDEVKDDDSLRTSHRNNHQENG